VSREPSASDLLLVEDNGLDVEAEAAEGWILLTLSAPTEGRFGSFTAMQRE
jgi:hypothetical protein